MPIGKPITGTTVHIHGQNGHIVKRGEIGELYVGGTGLALGYLSQPDLMCASFVQNLGNVECRLYRTGDLVRERADGVYEFVGRTDHLAKIRGHRVSIEHVELQLRQVRGVEEAIVRIQQDGLGENELVAAVQSSYEPKSIRAKIQTHLSQTLPQYMAPSRIEILATLPITENGKIDRNCLAALLATPSAGARND